MVIRRIGVWSAARMYGAISAVMGLLFGIMFALVSMVSAGFAAEASEMPAWAAGVFGVGAVIFLPLIYGVFGLVAGALSAVLYNVFAGMVGGLEIEAQDAAVRPGIS